jgi:hypothetical protein
MTGIDIRPIFAASIALFAAASYSAEFPNQPSRMIGTRAGDGICVNQAFKPSRRALAPT